MTYYRQANCAVYIIPIGLSYHEALGEANPDIQEGADIIVARTALSYFDIIRRIKAESQWQIAAYNVKGEYAMVTGGLD